MPRGVRPAAPLFAGLLLAVAGGAAQAAEGPVLRFHVRAAPIGEALVNIALQGSVSLGGDIGACTGRAPPISGRMSLEEALRLALAQSGCGFVRVDPTTVVIRGAPRTAAPAPVSTLAENVLGEVVVTFPRRAALAGRTPYAITANSGVELRAERIDDLGSLALGVAGMTTTNLGPGRNKIFLRGLSDGTFTGATQSTVALYLDDTPVTYNAPDPDLRLVDVERVEVLRGPQGTLYGGGTIGGVVKILTHRPDLDEWSGSVSAGASVTRSGEPGTSFEATANLPLSAGRAALRASLYRDEEGGYIDDLGLGKANVNKSVRSGGRAELRALLGLNWSANASFVHQTINTRDTQYGSVGLPPLQRRNAVAEPHDNDFDSVSLTLEGEGSWGRLSASTTRLFHNLDSRYDASPAAGLFGAVGPMAFDDNRHIDLWVTEAVLALPPGRRFEGLFGVFRSGGTTRINTDLRGLSSGAASIYSERRADEVNELAVYGELTTKLADRLSITAGARWFRYGYDVKSKVVQGGSPTFDGSGETMGVSPKFLVSYQATGHLLAYAQVAQGYRTGGFNTAGAAGEDFAGGLNRPSRQYGPDRLWNLEIGLKARLLNERLQVRAAAYLVRWSDIQTDQFTTSGLPYTLNVGNGRNQGVELETTWRASRRLEVKLAGLINEPQLARTNPAFAARSDAGLPGVPKVSGDLGLTYRRPMPGGAELTARLSAAYVGPSSLTFDALQVYRMGDYIASKASIGWSTGRRRAVLWVDNPIDEAGNTFAFGNPFRLGRGRETTPLRPRTVGLEFGADF